MNNDLDQILSMLHAETQRGEPELTSAQPATRMDWRRRMRVRHVATIGLTTICCSLLLGVQAPSANAVTTFTQDSVVPLSTVAGVSVSATLIVHSSSCTVVDALTVAVRDAANAQFDYPGAVNSVQICPGGFTLHTGARTFAAGSYRVFGAYRIGTVWTNFPSQNFNVGPSGASSAPSWNPTGSYTAVQADEFNTGTFNTALWEKGWFPSTPTEVTLPVNKSLELACYDPTYVTQPGDGFLHLKLNNVSSTCGTGANRVTLPNTASLISSRSKLERTGGNFEARIFLPANAANRLTGWPAWWLNGNESLPWPAHGEIDMIEGLSGSSSGFIHYATNTGADANIGGSSASPFVGWHNLGVKWQATGSSKTVTWYWDGLDVTTQLLGSRSNSYPATTPEYLILDYTISASSPTPTFPSEMLIDWVHVWQ